MVAQEAGVAHRRRGMQTGHQHAGGQPIVAEQQRVEAPEAASGLVESAGLCERERGLPLERATERGSFGLGNGGHRDIKVTEMTRRHRDDDRSRRGRREVAGTSERLVHLLGDHDGLVELATQGVHGRGRPEHLAVGRRGPCPVGGRELW